MARGYTNFNPGNIRNSGVRYEGEVTPSKDPSFKQFESMEYGYRAMFVLLHTYRVKYGLNTLQSMIERYAPPVENDTRSYVGFVSMRTKIADISTVDTLNELQMVSIVAAISRMENGVEPDMGDIRTAWAMFYDEYSRK